MKFIYILLLCVICSAGNLYEKLNVTQDATDREIRQSFRKLVLLKHPDKNKDNPNAKEEFIQLRHAYDVLKDEKERKNYDLYGEDGLEENQNRRRNFHSWDYYNNDFGIYDNDYPDIITLSKTDFEQSVVGGTVVWFINFYHPSCSHCHTLAPIWRDLAKELAGVVRFGAVNCDDAHNLCTSQQIRGYPTLKVYPKGIKYQGNKSKEHLFAFVVSYLERADQFTLRRNSLKTELRKCDKPWLVVATSIHSHQSSHRHLKISAIFGKILCMGMIDCDVDDELCKLLDVTDHYKYFSSSDAILAGTGTVTAGADTLEITNSIWALIPELPVVAEEDLEDMQSLSTMSKRKAHLVLILMEDELNNEMKKLPLLLPNVDIKRLKCSDAKVLCDQIFITRMPAFVIFKPNGGFEIHQGRQLVDDVATFMIEGIKSQKYRMLTPNEFHEVLADERPWFIEFYSPSCSPCLRMLPQFRKASRIQESDVNFGSIDCKSHRPTCDRYNIRQYPTTILYNGTSIYEYHGIAVARNIAQFVSDTLHSLVIVLDEKSFREKVQSKPIGETWVVDYFAGWCQPCQEMAPEYKKLARIVDSMKGVKIASIDCAAHSQVCRQQGVTGYPTIRLYPADSEGTIGSLQYNDWSRDADSFRNWIVSSFPSTVKLLNDESFENMLRSPKIWLVYFYAPWCQPCQMFAPKFEHAAQKLEKISETGKVNCENYSWICKAAGVNSFPLVKIYQGTSTGRQNPSSGRTFSAAAIADAVAVISAEAARRFSIHDEF